ncbi:RHS repeat-associated core domain-containing protein [uncultured Akkermansia sp.]|uniref:RHS repeat domain-containing protein n=1 Tax=uncultured Akkermansia sp. TaxID=512294 RepID=UPI00265D49C1|nr:RHS repeat-associated core domain-containing protein [uncultured Akkermansia sp.]
MSASSFQDDLNPLTNRTASNSGGGPEPFNKESDAFSDSWDWGIVVEPLQEGETATCRLTLGVDDNGSLTVDEQGVSIGPRGKYHGGTYTEKSISFPISPGPHQVHLNYENVSLPKEMKNLAILSYSVDIEVSGSSSSSSYVPDEGYPDPVDTDDDGEDTPCECSSSTSPSSSDSQSSSSNPCLDNDNGEGDNGEDPETEDPCACEDNAGGSNSGNAHPARNMRASQSPFGSSTAGKRIVTQTRKAEMIWRANFGSFRGMTGLPQGLLEIVGRTFSSELWTPRALSYWHPMANEITAAPPSGIGANTAFQIKSGGTNINYYSYAGGSGGSAYASSVGPIGGSAKRGGSALFSSVSARGGDAASLFSLSVRSNAGHTVSYAGGSASSLKSATSYASKNGAAYTREEFNGKLDIVRAADGGIRQIWNLWDGLANIENITASGYTIAFYLPGQVGEKNPVTGLYPVTGDPFKTFSVSGEASVNKLKIIEQTAGRASYATRYWQGTDGAWNMSQGEGEDAIYILKEKQTVSVDTWKLITTIQRGENGTPISRVCETFAVTRNGNLCTSRVEGYGTDYARETTYEYNGMGKKTKETAPDGSVKTWSYDRFGRETVATVPWAGGGDKATYTSYRDNAQADPDILVQRVTLTATAVDLWETTYTYIEENHVRRVEKRTTALGAEGERLEVKETWLGTAPNVYARGRLKMKQGIDGVQTYYAYEPTDQYEALYQVTAETRIAGEAVRGHSTRKVTYVSEQGNNTRYEQYALLSDGSWEMTDAATYEYDSENRWTKRTRANGRVTERAMMCCGPLWEKDEDGVTTTYSYNTARQLVEAIRSEVADGESIVTPETIISYTRDALGKITTLRKDIGPMTMTEHRSFDLLGRLTSETDILGRVTTHAYSNDGLTETVTTPMGGTLITQKHPDGTVLRQYGTGQRDIQYTTEAAAEGIVRSTMLFQEVGASILMEQSVSNGWGNVIRISQANANSGLIHKRRSFDLKSRLLQQEIDGMAPMLYDYDDFGNVIKTILKLDDAPTPANSLLTEYAYSREQRVDGIYRMRTTTNYDSQGNPYVQSTAALVSSLSSSIATKSIFTDPRGHVTLQWTEYTASSKRMVKTQIPTSSVIAESVVVDGYTLSRKDHASILTTSSRAYTESGRIETHTDPRGNATMVLYDIAGRETSVTDAVGNTTTVVYDPVTAQAACITNALAKTTCYAYDSRGRKTTEYGTAIYPSVFTYDDADRLVALTTFRVSNEDISTDPRERTDGDVTTWNYDNATGLVTAKTYADGHGESYSYDNWNRLVEKQQSRTVDEEGTHLTTSYAYDPQTGNLVSISHNDATPAVVYTYNHLNLLIQVADDSGIRTIAYNQYNETESETTEGLSGSTLNYQRDSQGRASGYALCYAESNVLQTVWQYDNYGRLSTASFNAVSAPFTYGYNVQNGLLDTLAYPNTLKRWYTREAKRDLPVKIDYLRPGSANYPAKTDYAYDELGRPTTKKDYFNAPNPDLTHVYSYNDRNELTADAMSRGGTYGYAYDNIGNRTTAQEGTEATATVYTANGLNQYAVIAEGRETPFVPEYDADGNQTKLQTTTGGWEVVYNALNQAVSFAQGNKRVECRYDYLNRRVEKAVYEGETLMSKKRFLYNGYLQIAELDATNATEAVAPILNKTYLWDPLEPIATRILAMTIFDGTSTYQEDLYYTHDALKNTTALFGIKAGRRALYEYGPYGSSVKMEGNAADINLFRFSSEYFDEETGMVQYNYRYYNVLDGRWLSRDLIGERSGWNLYSFVTNNPCLYFDRLGLSEDDNTECCKDGVKYAKISDDAGRECCEYEMQEVSILVKPCDYWSGNVGHAWVKTPNMQRGLYPDSWHKGSLGAGKGKIQDDAPNEKKAHPGNSYSYKACPESVDEVEKQIQEDEKNVPQYSLYNSGARNCCGWACEIVEEAGFTAPFAPDTPTLAPAPQGYKGYGEGRDPRK